MSRAEYRIKSASKLLKLPEGTNTLNHINQMNPKDREHLKSLVDWIETYDNAECEFM